MAKTKSEIFALIGANFPDNQSGLITPEKLREVTTQIADSMLYGVKEVEVLSRGVYRYPGANYHWYSVNRILRGCAENKYRPGND